MFTLSITEKVKPKTKKKEEPSSLFQRHRVDTLLLDLRSKFPPTFYQVFKCFIRHHFFLLLYNSQCINIIFIKCDDSTKHFVVVLTAQAW